MLITIKLMRVTRNNFQTGGRAPGAPALDPPLPPLNWMDNRSHITARIAKERQSGKKIEEKK